MTPVSPTDRPSHGQVVVLCSTAWGARNFVLSGVLDALRGDAAVHVLSNSRASNALSEQCEVGIQGEMLKVGRPRHDPLRVLLDASFIRRHRLRSFSTLNRWNRRGLGIARLAWRPVVNGFSMIGACQPFLDWQVALDLARARRRPGVSGLRAQLCAIAPDLVVSTASVVPEEAAYIQVAADLGIPTLGCILSFDNLSSRGRQPEFSHYAVWSRRMRRQVLQLYPGVEPSHVHVTGTPQFDLHRRPEYCWPRKRLLAQLGLRPDDRYVLYAANCALFTPTEPALVQAFCRRLATSPLTRDHRVVLRPHPADDLSRWDALAARNSQLVLSAPKAEDGRFATVEAQTRLVSTVAHADVCLNMASTMSLDAAVLDTPVVCVGFAIDAGSREDRLAAACHTTTHYAPVVASGGVRLAHSLDALMAETVAYVRDPTRDRAARRRLVDDICGPVDGAAASRVAHLIRSLLPEPSSHPGTAVECTARAAAGATW